VPRPKKPAKEIRQVTAVRLKPPVKAALQKAADSDARSMTSLVEKILVDWLKERGFLK
jgi:hypothetical protein